MDLELYMGIVVQEFFFFFFLNLGSFLLDLVLRNCPKKKVKIFQQIIKCMGNCAVDLKTAGNPQVSLGIIS